MTYCISDIHGCYEEFTALLEQINFSDADTLYILGDVIDRGDATEQCLAYIKQAKNIHCLKGNHEVELFHSFMERLPKYADWIRDWPLYEIVSVNGLSFFLSHAGIETSKPISEQDDVDLTWTRDFHKVGKLFEHIFIFGHTPTPATHDNLNCALWFDEVHRDKVCIDCGCVFGGALCALRLDDGAVFYEKALDRRGGKWHFTVEGEVSALDFDAPVGGTE